MPGDTIQQRFHEQVRSMGQRPAMHHREGGEWRTITWDDYGRRARAVALGLASLGVGPGDAVSVLSANRPEGHLADVGTMCAGGGTVPVYSTNSAAPGAHIPRR